MEVFFIVWDLLGVLFLQKWFQKVLLEHTDGGKNI